MSTSSAAAAASSTTFEPRCGWCTGLLGRKTESYELPDEIIVDATVQGSAKRLRISPCPWHACRRCAPLVEAGDHWALARRANTQMTARGLERPQTTAELAAVLRAVHPYLRRPQGVQR